MKKSIKLNPGINIRKPLLTLIMGVTMMLFFASCWGMPKQVWVDKSGLYPEGVEYYEKENVFFVTSLKEGAIGKVDKNGKYTRFIDDPELISAIGIRLDQKRNRILVANSDPGVSLKTSLATQKKVAGLAVYNLQDGKLIHYVDLAALLPKGEHFANDIALDEQNGTAYVTDSFSPVIYKVDVSGKAEIFLKNKAFLGQGFNLNGIVIIKDYLVVAKDNDGTLFKIPLNNPQEFSVIKTDMKFEGADGLAKDKNGNLILSVNGSKNTVYRLESGDDYTSAKVTASDDKNWRFNTTITDVCGKPYVLNAELNVLFSGQPDVSRYEIRQVQF